MYSRPPQSQIRRPWSPIPHSTIQSGGISHSRDDSYILNQNHHTYDYDDFPPQRRQQASESSVEALDLADYAMTLRANKQQEQYYHQYTQETHPPSPALRPLSRDSRNPPSLVSRGDTLSSNTQSAASRYPSRRPFSLPILSVSDGSNPYRPTYRTHNYPYLAEEMDRSQPDLGRSHDGIDISNFPAWSRSWYDKNPGLDSPPRDMYTALPPSQYNTAKGSPFDPGNAAKHGHYIQTQYDFNFPAPNDAHRGYSKPESSREYLPWSNDPPEYSSPIDSNLKEERMRMLEREFGPNAVKSGKESDFVDENGKPSVGTVDEKGNLVTQGPRKRLATRILEIILSLSAAVPSIYAALLIKPTGTPPPSGKVAAYVLYVVSVITFLGLFFLFAIRPCCMGREKDKQNFGNSMSNGMMVLPVHGLPGGKKKGKKGKKGKMSLQGGDVQVNLIVDPTAFGHGRENEEASDDEVDDQEMPGQFSGSNATARRKQRRPKRKSIFAGLAMEERWKRARTWHKKLMLVDVAGVMVWGVVFVVIMIGPRCPSGGFDGWCNAYNVSSAAACLLCVAFGISTFFDIKDLQTSKVSPRTRT